jgi:hypothetical protein
MPGGAPQMISNSTPYAIEDFDHNSSGKVEEIQEENKNIIE